MQLLEHLHTLTLNPANADRLKQLVLELAVRGKITEQWRKENLSTEPASILLERIKAEKAELIKEKKIKGATTRKEKPLPPIEADEIPYDLPENWEWCRLINICHLITDGTHHTPKYQEIGIPFLSVKNISKGYLDFSDTKFISEAEHLKLIERCHPEYQDILLTKIGTTGIAKVIDTDTQFSIFVSVALLKFNHQELNPNYLELVLNSPFVKRQSDEGTEGVGNKNLVLRKIKNFLITIPPLAEQKAIVSIVDELMERIDALTEEAKARIHTKHKLATAALYHLTQPEEDFSQRWQFVKSNFSLLFDDEVNVKKLRESILQLAVQGKLTEQWRQAAPPFVPDRGGTEPASVLLERIKAEKARLIKEKKIKKEKPSPPIEADEIPYKLPEGWVWCRLGEISNYASSEKVEPKDVFLDTWVLELEDVEKSTSKLLKKVKYKDRNFQSTKSKFNSGDVVYGKLRPYLDKVIVADEDGVCTTEMIPFRGYGSISSYYLRYVLKSPDFIAYANSSTHGMNLPRLGTDKAKSALIPLPPLAEQKAIVSIVDELMDLCDQLQGRAATAKAQEEKLMQALMHKVFEEEEREVTVVS